MTELPGVVGIPEPSAREDAAGDWTRVAEHVEKSAWLSDDFRYRYELSRLWGDWDGPKLLWVMLNPSTADHAIDDPTIRRCMSFSKAWGYHSLTVVNLFALRSTDPKALLKADDPVGPENDAAIMMALLEADAVVAAWGAGSPKALRSEDVIRLIAEQVGEDLLCLDVTKHGHPKHPLYVRGDTKPRLFKAASNDSPSSLTPGDEKTGSSE